MRSLLIHVGIAAAALPAGGLFALFLHTFAVPNPVIVVITVLVGVSAVLWAWHRSKAQAAQAAQTGEASEAEEVSA